MVDDYPDTLAVVSYHLSDGYQTPWGDGRANFYSVAAIPWYAYDGLWDAWPYTTYVSKFTARQAVTTTVTMSVGARNVGGASYETTVRTCLESGASPLNLRVYTVMVEDHWPGPAQGQAAHHRNTFRKAAPTTDISLSAGECAVTVNYLLPAYYAQNQLKVIAWAQTPASGYPAEVHQAGKDVWPFVTLPTMGDYDNNGDTDLIDFAAFPACMSGPDPAVLPDQACLSSFDDDGDADVDFVDYAAFTNAFTGKR